MKVKIRKQDKVYNYQLIKSWSDVTLETWAKLTEVADESKADEALETIQALSDIPKKLIKELSMQDVAIILQKLTKLQDEGKAEFKNLITVNGIEYGFHPRLEQITLGEWADIETFLANGLENNLPDVMAILYRPVTKKKNDIYTIEAYDGEIAMRAEEMKQMKAEDVQGAMVFFWILGRELLKILQSYLKERLMQIKKQVQTKTFPDVGVGLR